MNLSRLAPMLLAPTLLAVAFVGCTPSNDLKLPEDTGRHATDPSDLDGCVTGGTWASACACTEVTIDWSDAVGDGSDPITSVSLWYLDMAAADVAAAVCEDAVTQDMLVGSETYTPSSGETSFVANLGAYEGKTMIVIAVGASGATRGVVIVALGTVPTETTIEVASTS